jgi:hypothetical protein
MSIVIDTPEGIEHYRVAALLSALKLKANTGMDIRRGFSPMKMARTHYGCNGRTAKACLAEMETYYYDTYGMVWNKA